MLYENRENSQKNWNTKKELHDSVPIKTFAGENIVSVHVYGRVELTIARLSALFSIQKRKNILTKITLLYYF